MSQSSKQYFVLDRPAMGHDQVQMIGGIFSFRFSPKESALEEAYIDLSVPEA